MPHDAEMVHRETARIDHITTDQGNGAAFCSRCAAILGSDAENLPDVCPSCHRAFVYLSDRAISRALAAAHADVPACAECERLLSILSDAKAALIEVREYVMPHRVRTSVPSERIDAVLKQIGGRP